MAHYGGEGHWRQRVLEVRERVSGYRGPAGAPYHSCLVASVEALS